MNLLLAPSSFSFGDRFTIRLVAAGFSLRLGIPQAYRSLKGCGYPTFFPFLYYNVGS
jgi:hypothetical protein